MLSAAPTYFLVWFGLCVCVCVCARLRARPLVCLTVCARVCFMIVRVCAFGCVPARLFLLVLFVMFVLSMLFVLCVCVCVCLFVWLCACVLGVCVFARVLVCERACVLAWLHSYKYVA